jgi:hypothetical protein
MILLGSHSATPPALSWLVTSIAPCDAFGKPTLDRLGELAGGSR